jgi:gliding motility-associated-like protein
LTRKEFIFRIVFLLLVVLLVVSQLAATHNRAGEITFIQKGPLTFEATITLYTKTSSVAADRDSVEIFWGDGSSQFLVRSNGWGYPQPNDVKISYYIGTHTYPARGTYTMSMLDPNRIAGILNVNFPDSESVPFYLETTFTILNSQFQGENNSAVLLQAPIDIGCVGQIFKHNPNVYDPDGDSIAYELIIPLQAKNTVVPDYKYPQIIGSGPNNIFSFNIKNGDLIWNTPQIAGDYNVAFKVKEFRKGLLITSIIRDMQILVMNNCKSKPPILTIADKKCIVAGDTIEEDILASDPDPGQKILVNGSGEPFNSAYGLAFITDENLFGNSPVNRKFIWQTACEHTANPYYQIIFKAMDNSLSDTSGLTDLKLLQIKVSAPPPLNLKSQVINAQIYMTWQYPYKCSSTDNNFFKGFSVWRKENSNNFIPETCTPGLEGKGYKIIEYLTNAKDGINYYYTDITAEPGKVYCYRILAEFSYNTEDGYPYNPVQSLASNESCNLIPDNSPYLTKVSVLFTHNAGGSIEINWIKPDPLIFDTLKFPGPYITRILRAGSDNPTVFEEIPQSIRTFANYTNQDTFRFIDNDLNTLYKQYIYKAEFLTKNNDRLESKPASSIFLKAQGGNKKIILTADLNVPWSNTQYDYYTSDSFGGVFTYIGSNSSHAFTVTGLENKNYYFYKMKSRGSYPAQQKSIENFSQIAVGFPEDNQKPCPPVLSVKNECDDDFTNIPENDLLTYLTWEDPSSVCDSADDVRGYRIYYSSDIEGEFKLLYAIYDRNVFDTTHFSLDYSGCYYITSVDENGNESDPGEIVCAQNCPAYILPNTFTPNNDNQNDIFKPIYRRHIDHIELKVYNQWGVLVFETNDPDINWDGIAKSGKKLDSGTYYYICQVFSNNSKLELKSGFIEIIY